MTTEIRVDERGDETHESWLLIRANHVSSTGTRLFDSEIPHQHFIMVSITRCRRQRQLNHDYFSDGEILLEMEMSQAQWGAFVSSFGQGTGVPATLTRLVGVGEVPQAPAESRLEASHREVLDSGEKAVAVIKYQYAKVMEAFESGGRKALREELHSLHYAIENAPKNMEFAAKSLTKHAEAVVTKARADIEGMVLSAMERGELPEVVSPLGLERGEDTR